VICCEAGNVDDDDDNNNNRHGAQAYVKYAVLYKEMISVL